MRYLLSKHISKKKKSAQKTVFQEKHEVQQSDCPLKLNKTDMFMDSISFKLKQYH